MDFWYKAKAAWPLSQLFVNDLQWRSFAYFGKYIGYGL